MSAYSSGFSDRHILEVDDENGVINMKIHNVFIAALGSDIQYYSALSRSLDSSLGNMIEAMAISIAKINYDVKKYVEGVLYKEQRTVLEEMQYRYTRGVNEVEDFIRVWNEAKPYIDEQRWQEVDARLQHQLQNANQWRTTCLDYFGSFTQAHP